MLSKNARKTLRYAKRTCEKTVSFSVLQERFDWDFNTAQSACTQLIESGYAYNDYSRPYPGHELVCGIVLSEKGRNSTKYFWYSVGTFLIKSILVPIGVSFITALLTTLAIGS